MTGGGTTRTEPARPLRKLDLVEDMRFQQRNWRTQRVGWWVFLLILLLAVLGLFGEGLLSGARYEQGAVSVEYSRWTRRGMPTRIVIEVRNAVTPASLALSRSFASRLNVDSMVPPAAQSTATADGLLMDFQSQSPDSGWIQFDVVHTEAGPFVGWIRVADEPPVQIRQFVYP